MEIYLSMIVMVFLTGMIIFAFVLGGNKISQQIDDDPNATAIIDDTVQDVGEARTFFGVFITITGLVVVILLVLLLVRATRSEGITSGA